jgi:ATP-binding cassette subfamily B (MDR/TAP) protein 1
LANFAQVVGGVILAFVSSWKMTLVMLAASPVLMVAGLIETKLFTSSIKRTQKAYGRASNVANETISGVRTVYSFVAEEFMYNKFVRLLRDVYKLGVKRAHITGLGGVRFTQLFKNCHIILLINLLV